MDIGEIEQEQLDYIKRNGITIPSDEPYPDPLTKPIDTPIVLTPDQEAKIIKDLREKIEQEALIKQTPVEKINKDAQPLSFSRYMTTMSTSFVGIMNDLLNFDGNLEDLPLIFTKENRLVFIASILIVVALVLLKSRNPEL